MNTNDLALLITIASFFLPASGDLRQALAPQVTAQALGLVPDPPRVKVSRSGVVRTVRTGTGQLLRGIAIPSFRFQREEGLAGYLSDPKYWADLKAVGINSIRLVAFDAWQRSHGDAGGNIPYPYTDLYNPQQTADMLAEFDLIVDQAAAHGMVVMLNYHDVGGYHDPDFTKPANENGAFERSTNWQYVNRFWNIVAPRYANRSHVFYELLNEPKPWMSDDYTLQDIRRFKVLFDKVRAAAPRTHIVVCSFATHYSRTARTMREVAFDMVDEGIDFGNASIGFHPYNALHPERNLSQPIYDLMKNFTVINTEQNFPAGMIPGSSDPDMSGFDGDRMGVQSMERMRISWFHWNSGPPEEFRFNFRGRVVRDAKAKGYYWVRQ